MNDLRGLAAAGSLLVAAGCAVGWFERTVAAQIDGPVRVVRPGSLWLMGWGAWPVLLVLVLSPFVLWRPAPTSRRAVRRGLVAALPGTALIVAAAAMRPRAAVAGETIGEVVIERTLGQALALVGALMLVMALGEGWRRAPDWAVPAAWEREGVEEARTAVPER